MLYFNVLRGARRVPTHCGMWEWGGTPEEFFCLSVSASSSLADSRIISEQTQCCQIYLLCEMETAAGISPAAAGMNLRSQRPTTSTSQSTISRYDAVVRLVLDKYFLDFSNENRRQEVVVSQMSLCMRTLFDLPVADMEESRKSHLARISLQILLCILTKRLALAKNGKLSKRTSMGLSTAVEDQMREFLLITSTMMANDTQYHHLLDEVLCLLEENACFYNKFQNNLSFTNDFATDMVTDVLEYVALFYGEGCNYSHFGRSLQQNANNSEEVRGCDGGDVDGERQVHIKVTSSTSSNSSNSINSSSSCGMNTIDSSYSEDSG